MPWAGTCAYASAAGPGGSLELTVLRGTEERSVHVVLGESGQAATEA